MYKEKELIYNTAVQNNCEASFRILPISVEAILQEPK